MGIKIETEKAVLLIAEVLDVLSQFMPDCGGDFIPRLAPVTCKDCKFYSQCEQMTKAQEINSKLQRLLIGKDLKILDEMYDAYNKGFRDACLGHTKNNLYAPMTELYKMYKCGYFDGAV